MSWLAQAKIFYAEVKATKAREDEEDSVAKEDMEFVSSASEARLLDVPQGASFLIILSVITMAGLIIWSMLMQVDEVAKTQGKVIPSKQVQVIQSLEGGIVKVINVMEGQTVQKGDVLLEIDDVYAKSDVDENVNSYNNMLARLVALNTLISGKRLLSFPGELQGHVDIMSRERERFNAEWDLGIAKVVELEAVMDQRQKELDSAVSERDGKKINYQLASEQLKLNQPLLKSGAISRIEIIKIKQEVNRAESDYTSAKNAVPKAKSAFHEARQRRESYVSSAKVSYEKERNEIQTKLNGMQAKGVSLQAKLSHSKITSPVVGTVKKINFNTIGGVIRPGMDIMEIVPTDDKLLVEVKIKPKDIGFITLDQRAVVKITAFDYSTYGGLEGDVVFISADTITDKKGNSFYLARIRTKTNEIKDKKGGSHVIIPGMRTQVNIVLDQKSILSYLLKPMLK